METLKLTFIFCVLCLFMGSKVNAQQIDENKLKRDVYPMSNSVQKLMQLEPVSFNYNNEKFNKLHLPEGKQYGFLANDVKMVIPEIVIPQNKMVPSGKNAFKTNTIQNIDMSALIPFLVSSIKEQQSEIEKLKEEIKALKAKQ